MNIPELSMAMSQSNLSTNVGIAVLGKSLESLESAGEMVTDMLDNSMELSVNPNIGSNINLLI